MFSYYGSKSKIVGYYPPPKFDKIIEPFAGSARYSLKWWRAEIILIDLNIDVVNAWKYLISASKKDILSLPYIKHGDNLKDFNLSEEERFIIYCCATGGGAGSGQGYKITASDKSGFNSWNQDKIRIAESLFKIKHWKVFDKSFLDLKNEEATWFIDPPYQNGGHKYKHSNKLIDYSNLAEWCKSRLGQIVICENTKADWLPFLPMIEMNGIKFKTTEAIWSNYPTNYDHVQQSLF